MEGFDSHNNNWMYNHTLPPSNLSAFATPFTVNRGDNSTPFMDLADTLSPNPNHYPANTRSYEYTFFPDPKTKLDSPTPPSNPYAFSYCGSKVSDVHGSQIPHMGQCSNTTKSSLAEVNQYFPSYVSPVVNDQNSSVSSVVSNHWSSFSRFTTLGGSPLGDYADESPELGFGGKSANQFAEFNRDKGKSVGIGTSFSSNHTNVAGSVVEESLNLGYQDIRDNNGGVLHMTDWEKNSVPSADQLDDKSCWWPSIKPSQVEFSVTSIQQPASLSLETHHEVPLELGVNSGNHQFSFTGAYDKYSRQQDKPSRVDTVSSTPMMVSAADLINHNSVAYGNLGHSNLYNIKEAYPMPSLGTAGCFDLSHLRMHLERNESSSSNNTMISDRNVSMDDVDYTHKAMHGFENHHLNLDNLSLRLGATEDANSIEKSFVYGDMCNPAVDSPCWKGAPTTCFSHYEALEDLPPEHVHKNVEFFGSVIQEAQNFLPDRESNVKKSYDMMSNRCQMDIGIVDEETSSAASRRKLLETKFGSADCNSDGAVNAEHFQSEPSCDYGLHYREDITKMKESSVPPTKPIDCEAGYSHDEHQVIKENKLVSQKSHTLCIGGTDAGCNENKCSESGTPLSAEHVLSSPFSVANAPITPDESAGKLSVQMLVDAMQNMSELLLNHCLNDDTCELKERDCDVLRNVISNLNSCVLKNAEEITPAQECLLHQLETSKCAGEPCELQQNVHLKGPQSTKTGPESSNVECEGYLHFGSGKPNQISLDAISLRGDAETTKAEKMTKALKMILSENFDGDDDEATESQTALYKNLWLDAEAALCSVNYRARYNQMKIEMGKHSDKQRGMEEQSKDEVIPSLSKSQSSATEVHNNPHPDSSAQNLPVLDATDPNAGFKISIDINEPNPLKSEGEGRQGLNSFIQNDTVSGSNKEVAGNDEMAQSRRRPEMFRLLRSRHNTNDLPVLDATDPNAGFKISIDINEPKPLKSEGEGRQGLNNFIQNDTVSGSNKEAAGNDEMAQSWRRLEMFRLLRARNNTNDLQKPSEVADKLADGEIDNQNKVIFCQDSPISGNKEADYEASVLARFDILKARDGGLSSLSSEEKWLDGAGSSGKEIVDTIINENASEGKNLDAHLNSHTDVDKSISKEEVDLDLYVREIEAGRAYEFQVPNYSSDGCASDWEHI